MPACALHTALAELYKALTLRAAVSFAWCLQMYEVGALIPPLLATQCARGRAWDSVAGEGPSSARGMAATNGSSAGNDASAEP